MSGFIMAQQNGRTIPKEDKIFGATSRGKARIEEVGKENVIISTIGSLLDDNGKLAVLSSVAEGLKSLSPEDYADYAPIGGTPGFKEAIKKAAFMDYVPNRFVEVVATPGGTGGLRNTISNYSKPGEKVLTSDWYWAPYKTIAQEQGRDIATYTLFDENRQFNAASFEEKVNGLLELQESLVIFLNTPAHNPTGYSLTEPEWNKVIEILNKATEGEKKVILFVDAAYVDFAGDPKEYRAFLPLLENLGNGVLPIIGYSASKTFTMYGMRCGAMICLAKDKDVADEFKTLNEFSSRGSWSNCTKASQVLIDQIYKDEELLKAVDKEREEFREMLLSRGQSFEAALKAEGVEPVPFDAGFFVCVAADDPDAVAAKLEEKNVFAVALAKGIRISVASSNEKQLKIVAKAIGEVMNK